MKKDPIIILGSSFHPREKHIPSAVMALLLLYADGRQCCARLPLFQWDKGTIPSSLLSAISLLSPLGHPHPSPHALSPPRGTRMGVGAIHWDEGRRVSLWFAFNESIFPGTRG